MVSLFDVSDVHIGQEMLLVCMIGQREGHQSVTGLSTLPRPYKTP